VVSAAGGGGRSGGDGAGDGGDGGGDGGDGRGDGGDGCGDGGDGGDGRGDGGDGGGDGGERGGDGGGNGGIFGLQKYMKKKRVHFPQQKFSKSGLQGTPGGAHTPCPNDPPSRLGMVERTSSSISLSISGNALFAYVVGAAKKKGKVSLHICIYIRVSSNSIN